jgi:hypothetical protein
MGLILILYSSQAFDNAEGASTARPVDMHNFTNLSTAGLQPRSLRNLE